MQIQGEQVQLKQSPFEIIYNARTSRPSRSRKSSISIVDREKPICKTKKLRKMTMNPQSIRFQQIREIEELLNQQKAPCSQKGDIKEESINIDEFLEFDISHRLQSQKEQELQNGILLGICDQRQLNSDFDLIRPDQIFQDRDKQRPNDQYQ